MKLKEITLREHYDNSGTDDEELVSLSFVMDGLGGYGYVDWTDKDEWHGSFMGRTVSGSRCKILAEAQAHAAFLVRSLVKAA